MAICSSGDVLGYCIEQMVMPLLLEAANITGSHIVSALSGDEFLVVPTDGHTTIDFVCQSVDKHLEGSETVPRRGRQEGKGHLC